MFVGGGWVVQKEEVKFVYRNELYSRELEKLKTLFKDVEPTQAILVDGLIEDAAFLYAENAMLKATGLANGMIKVHPEYPELQKEIPAGKQYLKNVNSYAVIIKTLYGILQKGALEQNDAFDEFLESIHAKS